MWPHVAFDIFCCLAIYDLKRIILLHLNSLSFKKKKKVFHFRKGLFFDFNKISNKQIRIKVFHDMESWCWSLIILAKHIACHWLTLAPHINLSLCIVIFCCFQHIYFILIYILICIFFLGAVFFIQFGILFLY